MRREFLDRLCCPMCKGELTASLAGQNGDEVIQGSLRCERCALDFPVKDGVPSLLPPELRK